MIPKKVAAALAEQCADAAPARQAIRLVINRIAAARGLPEPWPVDLTEARSAEIVKQLGKAGDLSAWGAAELGELREQTTLAVDRKSGGVWHTPPAVAEFMARFTLTPGRPCPCGAAGCGLKVSVLDPACGAGVFLVAAARQVAKVYAGLLAGTDDPPAWGIQSVLPLVMTECVFGIDIDPIAIDLAKSACWLEISGLRAITWMDDNIVCGDPLAAFTPKLLNERLEGGNPLVILGNPPYREHAKGSAPWLEQRRSAGPDELVPRPSMDEFRTGERTDGKLSNLWTFFWRWALWQAFESRDVPGWVGLITPKYMTSPTFASMVRHMQRVADEGWYIDISPEGHQPPVPTRIFPTVKTPLCIGIFTKYGGTAGPNSG